MEFKRGDSDRITRDYFDSILLEMRMIDAVLPTTQLTLYNKTFKTPVMTAALSHLNNILPDGMVEMAKGATAAGAVTWCGTGATEELEAMVQTGADVIKIIKPYEDNEGVIRKIQSAERCGAFAVGMDIDHAFSSYGEYDQVNGLVMRPKSTKELKEFVEATKLPFIIKGVLSERDAEKCLEIGARGIVVSHHHGIMDYAVPPLKVLPGIVKSVGGKIPIFVDCGISSGMDVFKCLALGATAVSVGRTIMGPLKQDGAKGVKNSITDITAQLKGAMARTGAGSLQGIDPAVLWTLNGKYCELN